MSRLRDRTVDYGLVTTSANLYRVSDRLPVTRRESRGRHRAPAAPLSTPLTWRSSRKPGTSPRLRAGKIGQGALALGLVVALGGYTLAESSSQRRAAETQQAELVTAQRAQAAVSAEREQAVASARVAVSDAAVVQTVAAGSLTEAELAPLSTAVAELTTLIEAVPEAPAPLVERAADPASDPDSSSSGSAVDPADLTGVETASQGVSTDTDPVAGAGVVSVAPGPSDLASAFAASDAAREAALAGTAEPAQAAAPTDGVAAPAAGATAPVADATAPATDATAPDAKSSADTENQPDSQGQAGVEGQAGGTAPETVTPDDEVAAGIVAAAAEVSDLTAQVKTTAEAKVAEVRAAATAAAEAVTAAAEQEAAAAAEKAAQRASLEEYANGRVPEDALCALGFASKHQLRCDASEALDRLNASYLAAFGANLTVTDSYRSYAAQVACSRSKGRLCAAPGTSNHGRGVAVDLGSGIERFGSKQHVWMVNHAGEFGWTLPDWASRSGSKPEPWHWEFTG